MLRNVQRYAPRAPLEDGEKTRIVHLLVGATHVSMFTYEHGWGAMTTFSVVILLAA